MTSKHFPGEVLVGMNQRDPRVFDMYRIDLATGEAALDTENPGDVLGWMTDAQFQIRGAMAMNPADASKTLRVRDTTAAEWRDLITWPQEENGGPKGFNKSGNGIFVESSLGCDTTRLLEVSCEDGSELREIAHRDLCDVGATLFDDDTKEPQAVSFNYQRKEWVVLDPTIQKDFDAVQALQPGRDFSIASTDQAERTWVVTFSRDDGPSTNYLYSRDTGESTFLFTTQPKLEEYDLAPMKPVVIEARDGEKLVSFLTLPVAGGEGPFPLVLNVHGGPWARDVWGCRPDAQWFANRGYACLQVNFRGSTGFGKRFLHLGDKQWGVGTMQHDLTDSVRWAVDQGIADPAKLAIYGGSYGGYAALAGLTFTPELFACGVDIVGPSHVLTLFQSIPAYWAPMKKQLIDRVGDVEADDALNRQISPLYHVDKIQVPLLIGQGANDPRVKQAESDQIYEAMKAKGLPVEYYVYTDEGHGFARPENKLDFYSKVERFLQQHLGGRAAPAEEVEGASAVAVHEK
mmetsp:Transcript_11626/g.36812  ORF Transcript_11626/g.36812 Transcript_11626/m.36812 type:complete len:517 (+) Transcript_11626:981-2531(+)|eukprot:CAMPEP_0182872552 /NCGR_PEP_ID=MMETSP0034_2-20130328/11773_1 /TAXON_ID=156128 /ORGANISM="Nephroselmis pyriformis, Strain CCMP717" /LENGTH=516 /DNA_ID=CAMNT_0025005141 /DNA_START=21 /DNA_END=1571 /DNA_ORIENTATION=-